MAKRTRNTLKTRKARNRGAPGKGNSNYAKKADWLWSNKDSDGREWWGFQVASKPWRDGTPAPQRKPHFIREKSLERF